MVCRALKLPGWGSLNFSCWHGCASNHADTPLVEVFDVWRLDDTNAAAAARLHTPPMALIETGMELLE
jgi:hypothetical protein